MTTSLDIAKRAGFSQATVSRVIRGASNVKPATRQKIMDVMRELGYQPNALARAMRTNATGTIGVVVARLSNPLYPELLDVLNRRLSRLGKRMIVWDSEGAGEEAASEAIQQSIVDGVIFTTATARSMALQEAIRAGAPAVLVNRTVDGFDCDQVSSDNLGGAARVAEYFVGNRRRRIALIGSDTDASTIRDRERGFIDALDRLGRPLNSMLWSRGPISHESGHSAMRELLQLSDPPDAVFCVNDVMAFGALDAMVDLGRRAPEDTWVVGFDDVDVASWSTVSLTTVRQPMEQLIDRGIDLLLKRIHGDGVEPERVCLPTELVIRRTTGYAPLSLATSKSGSESHAGR